MPELVTPSRVRAAIYRRLVATGQMHTPVSLAERFDTTPAAIVAILRYLEAEEHALVMLPSSHYVWMASPFSALPTDYPVASSDGRKWFGNCIWDALGIASLVDSPTRIQTRCPVSKTRLTLNVEDEHISGDLDAAVHFAVPARNWFDNIGFT